ncbi:MAG: class I tRNA ligase family protein, partial [Eggerthellaceae bacterium]|nr:class I tRNA ligase family protein [Eggerthellaceae bacterium]
AADRTLCEAQARDEKIEELADALARERHRVVGKVSADIERNNFNTALAAIMELVNAASNYVHAAPAEVRLEKHGNLNNEVAEILVLLLAPFAPHWAEELWSYLWDGQGAHAESVHTQSWPEYDEAAAKASSVELAIQINGKVKARIVVDANAEASIIESAAHAAVEKDLAGKNIVKTIVIPQRLVNIVVK